MEEGQGTTVMSWWVEILKLYGPHTYGFAMFMLMWFAVFQPEMERNRITFDEQERIVQEMKTIVVSRNAQAETYLQGARSQEIAAATMLQASQVLKDAADRLQTITDTVLRSAKERGAVRDVENPSRS